MKKKEIIGVDVSKETLDVFLICTSSHLQIANNKSGYIEFINHVHSLSIELNELLVVMEHTGLYSYPFEKYLNENGIRFSKVSALEIKKSAGIVRGKSDKKDAQMIAEFAVKCFEKLSVSIPSQHNYLLKALLGLREKLVTQKAGFTTSLKEQTEFMNVAKRSTLFNSQKQMIRTLEKEIFKVEQEIMKLIESDPNVKQNLDLLMSIVGVGFVIAVTMIVLTDNFTKFKDARKFACYSGIAPFEYSSGTSIKKRTKVSHFANKKIKALLDLGARSAIIHDPEMKQFHARRIKEGKHEKCIRNIIRNKLVYRMFAVINRKEPYIKNYIFNAA